MNKKVTIKRVFILYILFLITSYGLIKAETSNNSSNLLTNQETVWLKEHKKAIKIGIVHSPPQVILHNSKQPIEGLSIDLIQAIEKILNCNFLLVPYPSSEDMNDALEMGNIDMSLWMNNNCQPQQSFLISQPYIRLKNKIVTSEKNTKKINKSNMENLIIGVLKNSSEYVYLKQKYPDVKIHPVCCQLTGLIKLSIGNLDATVIDEISFSYFFNHQSIDMLSIVGAVDHDYQLNFAIRKDLPVLESIINKAIGAIPEKTKRTICIKWKIIDKKRFTHFFKKNFLKILAATLIISVISILIWTYTLKNKIKLKTKELQKQLNENKKTLKELQKSEHTLKTLLHAAPIGIGWVKNRIIGWTNELFSQITLYTPEEINGKNARILYPSQEEFERVGREKHADVIKYGVGAIESKWVRKNGKIIDVLLSSSATNPEDLSAGLVFTVMDITEQKKAKEERENLIKKLEKQNAELEQYTYTVSHDLKAPLITIEGFLNIFTQEFVPINNKDFSNYLKRMLKAVKKMRNLLEDLLELSKIGRLVNDLEEIDINHLVLSALENMEGSIKKQKVKIYTQENMPKIFGDKNRLFAVVMNLLDNAIKFINPDDPQPLIEIGCVTKNNETLFFIKDNGIGIEQKYENKIFGLFEKLNSNDQGTGIGLAISKRIIQLHGGKIWAESKGINKGTTFYFTIPNCTVYPK